MGVLGWSRSQVRLQIETVTVSMLKSALVSIRSELSDQHYLRSHVGTIHLSCNTAWPARDKLLETHVVVEDGLLVLWGSHLRGHFDVWQGIS